jgi:hypothetical protein
VRAFDTLLAARQAKAALERLLAINDWPEDRALSLAIDRLVELDAQASAAIKRAAAWDKGQRAKRLRVNLKEPAGRLRAGRS